MSEAYRSVLNISTSVKAGLLIRQTHHWAANVFVAAIVLHLLRVFFTGAYRKPRELTYFLGLTMLMVALLEGYLGYSMVDDLLSGMGLAIGYSVAVSIPIVGANLGGADLGRPLPRPPPSSRACTSRTSSSSRRSSGCCSPRTSLLVALQAPHAVPERAARRRSGSSSAFRRSRARRRGRSACSSSSPACSSCSAASRRSTRSGSGGRTTPTSRRTARSRTGTSAG